MKSRSITFSNIVSRESHVPRIGGCALLPPEYTWPTTPDGLALSLLFSIPANFIENETFKTLSEDLFVSGFIYHSPTDYCLDKITSNDNKSLVAAIGNFTKIIIHKIGIPRTEGTQIEAKEISTGNEIENPNSQASKIAGFPGLLQHIQTPHHLEFALQFYSSDISEQYSDILGLSDSIGYIFLPTSLQADEQGILFTQCT